MPRLSAAAAVERDRRLAAGECWCIGCGAWHPVAEFGRSASSPTGYDSRCRDTRNQQVRAARLARGYGTGKARGETGDPVGGYPAPPHWRERWERDDE